MMTRLTARDARSRQVFEQPPILDVILRHLSYETEMPYDRDVGRDFVNMRCVFKSPCATDVIKHHELVNKKRFVEYNTFVTDVKTMLEECSMVYAMDAKRVIVCKIFEYMVVHKHILDLSNFTKLKLVVLIKLEEFQKDCPIFKRDWYPMYKHALST